MADRERVLAEQCEDLGRALEEAFFEPEEPRRGAAIPCEGGEPHLPVEPGHVRRCEPRATVELAGLPAESVRLPVHAVVAPLDGDLGPFVVITRNSP